MLRSLQILWTSACLLLALEFTFFCGVAFAKNLKPVLIIIRASDSGYLDERFIKDEQEAKSMYAQAGFSVITLDDSAKHPLTASTINKAIRTVKTSELHLLILTHGDATQDHRFYAITSAFGSPPPWISGEEIRRDVLAATGRNPKLKVYVPILSCYGGTLGEQLADIPGVTVLPSSGDDRATLLNKEVDPIDRLLSALSAGQTYSQAEEAVWQAQFAVANEPAYALDELRLDSSSGAGKNALSLLRTEPQLFLQTWCANRAQAQWATQAFCIPDRGVGFDDTLKTVAFEDVQATNLKHLQKLRDLKDRIKCSPSSFDPNLGSFISMRISMMKSTLNYLQAKVDSATVERYRQNEIDFDNSLLQLVRQHAIQWTNEQFLLKDIQRAQQESADKLRVEMGSAKKRALEDIQAIQQNCVRDSTFPYMRTFKFSSGEPSSCAQCLKSQAIYSDLLSFSPADAGSVKIDPTHAIENPAPGTPVDVVLQDYPQSIMKYFTQLGEKHPVQAAAGFIAMDFPIYKNEYCQKLEGSVREINQDIDCAKEFQSNATAADWSRFLDLTSLEDRKLLPGGEP